MNVESTQHFNSEFDKLPAELQEKNRKTIISFIAAYQTRQFPKGLRIHKCGPFISISVTMDYRIFVSAIPGGVRFVFVGDHDEADRYLRK